MNIDRLKYPAFFLVAFSPFLFFGWWSPTADHSFSILTAFMLLWYIFWAGVFFAPSPTPVECINLLVREGQAIVLATAFVASIFMLLFNASLRTVFFLSGFLYVAFFLVAFGIILYNKDLIDSIDSLKGGRDHEDL